MKNKLTIEIEEGYKNNYDRYGWVHMTINNQYMFHLKEDVAKKIIKKMFKNQRKGTSIELIRK